ncbi:uncharacterized protein BJ171DRAFT_292560 [Polychytrium aggregatum]|uniref:uncharacterized protein n=1 Tax=Polychytrium aggregatum TaxID=110093 RepID=UPI0022FEF324|nr:uncharacterized protein BJ171DRAFT_292560 [Polychytrium aggregatum]KAI9207166.1 hypothetical protein BJ171DRAFT_292560 [Polychytrium aggregatum]
MSTVSFLLSFLMIWFSIVLPFGPFPASPPPSRLPISPLLSLSYPAVGSHQSNLPRFSLPAPASQPASGRASVPSAPVASSLPLDPTEFELQERTVGVDVAPPLNQPTTQPNPSLSTHHGRDSYVFECFLLVSITFVFFSFFFLCLSIGPSVQTKVTSAPYPNSKKEQKRKRRKKESLLQSDPTIRPYNPTLQSDPTIRPYNPTLQSDKSLPPSHQESTKMKNRTTGAMNSICFVAAVRFWPIRQSKRQREDKNQFAHPPTTQPIYLTADSMSSQMEFRRIDRAIRWCVGTLPVLGLTQI